MDLTKRDEQAAAEFARRFENLLTHWLKSIGATADDSAMRASAALGLASYCFRYANHHRPSRVLDELVEYLQSGQVYSALDLGPVKLILHPGAGRN